ncbi:MAG TPA: hypothetical protein VFM94_08565 [Solirubrobacterales bacterium]|nr:hypothetical protein [Solirubrobacterales bacterium]
MRGRTQRRLLLAAVAAIAAVWLISSAGGSDDRFRLLVENGADQAAVDSERQRDEVARALRASVGKAAALGGSVEAAAMLAGWPRPVVVTSESGGAGRWMRLWSMSKVVTMVGLLRAEGWDGDAGNPLSAELEEALEGAIRRSENCHQRRVVLELQEATGGPAGARRAVEEAMRVAGGEVKTTGEVEAPDPSCVEYLEGQHAIPDPLAPGALLGTSEWRIGDAIGFIDALGQGAYGEAVTDRVLAEMRLPKATSREVAPGELTAPLDWGAGRAFAGLEPAYKAGWGGSQDGNFLAGQIALVDLDGVGRLAIAVAFHPDVQPPSDDPGRTPAPAAIELVMASVRESSLAARSRK